ncbi:hypothetical protein Tco_1459730, partial [Tanacetum coccineum]
MDDHGAAPLSPAYVPEPIELEHHILVYIPEPVYPEYHVPSDDDIQIEDQPYAADASPSALSLGYIVESDLEKDPEEDSEEDPIDYAADTDDDDKEEKEHLAPDVALLAVDPVPSAEETEPFKTDKSVATSPPLPAYRTTFRMSGRTQTPIPFPSEEELKALIEQGVANSLASRNADRSQNGEDNHDSGTGVRRQAPLAHECTYPDFMKCKPLYFKGTKGVIELTQWTVGHDVAYAMTWTNLKKKMTNKYCPRGEIKKLEVEMMFLEESDKIEKYVGGLPDMIHESVKPSKPRTVHNAIEFETELMDKKISTFDERQADNKRKFDDTSKNNQNQQQPPKRQNVARAYTAGPGEKKPCGGSKPLCSKCNYHHDGQCAPKCHKCKRGHFKKDCLKLKNKNQGNQAGVRNDVARDYAAGAAETNLNANVVT